MGNKSNEQILKSAEADAKWGVVSGAVSAVASLYSGFMGNKTAKIYGRMQQKAAETQARLNSIATERNIGYQTRQTADAISDVKREGRQVLGRQLAAMAATGMSTASGSSQALMRSTGYSVGRDVSTLQANLINSAYEQRRQTAIENIGLQYQGQMARLTGKSEGFGQLAQGFQGLMSAATSVAQKWNRWEDLQFKNAAQAPGLDPTSQAEFRSYLNELSYEGYSLPSTTKLNYDFVDAAGSAAKINSLELPQTQDNWGDFRRRLTTIIVPRMGKM